MKRAARIALTATAAAAFTAGGAGVAAAETPAPGSIPDGPIVDMLAPLIVTETHRFGANDGSEYACNRWAGMAPGWGYFNLTECTQGEDGQWTLTAQKWPDWMTALGAGSLA